MIDKSNSQFISSKNGESIELLFEERAAIELKAFSDVLIQLIGLQVDETYEPPVLFHRINVEKLKCLFQFINQKMSCSSSKVISAVYRKLMNRLFPNGWFFGWTKQDEFNWARNDASQLLAQNRFALAKINGEIVSVAAYKLGGQMEDGRKVFELTKFITLPDYRGRGLYRVLRQELIRRVQQRYPDAPLVTFTKNKTVIHQCLSMGWRPLSLEIYSKMTKRIGRTGLSPEDMAALKHWKSFILEPESTLQC